MNIDKPIIKHTESYHIGQKYSLKLNPYVEWPMKKSIIGLTFPKENGLVIWLGDMLNYVDSREVKKSRGIW